MARTATVRTEAEGNIVDVILRPRLRLVGERDPGPFDPPLENGGPPYLVAFRRGWRWAADGDDAAALVEFRKATKANPGFDLAHYNMGAALHNLGKVHDAIAAYGKAIAIDPKFADAHYAMGLAYGEIGHRRDAELCLRKAFALDPRSEYACGLAWLFAKRKIYDRAIAALQQAIEVEPDKNKKAEISAKIEKYKSFDKGGVIKYTTSVMDITAEFHAAADSALNRGVTLVEFRKAVDKLAAKTQERMATSRAPAEPRSKKSASPELTIIRLKAAFETLKRSSDLDNPKLSAGERQRKANHLVRTYERLHERDPGFHDDSGVVARARSIVNDANYQRRKKAKAAKAAAMVG